MMVSLNNGKDYSGWVEHKPSRGGYAKSSAPSGALSLDARNKCGSGGGGVATGERSRRSAISGENMGLTSQTGLAATEHMFVVFADPDINRIVPACSIMGTSTSIQLHMQVRTWCQAASPAGNPPGVTTRTT